MLGDINWGFEIPAVAETIKIANKLKKRLNIKKVAKADFMVNLSVAHDKMPAKV